MPKTDITLDEEFSLDIVRPEAEPDAVQIDAYIGTLHLGQFTYYATSVKEAKKSAIRRIQTYGSLN
jgi:hypothetical protein